MPDLKEALSCELKTANSSDLRPLNLATGEELSKAMTELLDKDSTRYEKQRLANLFLEKINYMTTSSRVQTYIEAYLTALDQHPGLLMASIVTIFNDELIEPVIPERAKIIANNMLLFFDINKKSVCNTTHSTSNEHIQYMSAIITIAFEKYPKTCDSVLKNLAGLINQQTYLSPQAGTSLLNMLFTVGIKSQLLNNIFKRVERYDITKSKSKSKVALSQISDYLYHLRILHLNNLNGDVDVRPHLDKMCAKLEGCIGAYSERSPFAPFMHKLKLVIFYLKKQVTIGNKLQAFLDDVDANVFITRSQSPIEVEFKKKLEVVVNNLKNRYPSSEIVIKNNLSVEEFELDFCIAVTTHNKTIQINVEVDTQTFHGSSLATLKNEARDKELGMIGIPVIRVKTDEAISLSDLRNQISVYIENFHSENFQQLQDSRMLTYLYNLKVTVPKNPEDMYNISFKY